MAYKHKYSYEEKEHILMEYLNGTPRLQGTLSYLWNEPGSFKRLDPSIQHLWVERPGDREQSKALLFRNQTSRSGGLSFWRPFRSRSIKKI